MGIILLVNIFALARAASSSIPSDTGCDSGSCEVHGEDLTSLLVRKRQLKSHGVASVERGSSPGKTSACTKMGLLALEGYYWPTQPGDANDVRTFCRVKPEDVDDFNYSCELPYQEDEYGTVVVTVKNFTFANAQKEYMHGMKKNFGNAVKYLLEDPDVCAIICNVGFCAYYQSTVDDAITDIIAENSTLVRKPMLLGSPYLAWAYLPQQDDAFLTAKPVLPLGPDDVLIIITADYPSLNEDLLPLFDAIVNASFAPWAAQGNSSLEAMDATIRRFHFEKQRLKCPEGFALKCTQLLKIMLGSLNLSSSQLSHSQLVAAAANKTAAFRGQIEVIGWNEMPGYKPVDLSGGFHNALLTSQNYKTYNLGGFARIKADIEANGQRILGVVIESTEQATNANDFRIDYGLPTWDFSTVGICLGAVARSGDFDTSEPIITKAVFKSRTFSDCLLRWSKKGKLEPKFGKQADGTFKFYENLTKEEVLTLTCVGGRPKGHPPIGRLMDVFDIGVPSRATPPVVCHTTELCKCHHHQYQLSAPCKTACAGSGNCGGGSSPYPCGATGEKCKTLADVPRRAGKCYDLGAASVFKPTNTTANVVVYATK